jgi:class 3 adenylate cyclase
MLRVAIGQSEGIHGDAVLDSVLEQCDDQLQGETPRAGIVLASGDFDHARILAALVERYPGIALIGATARATLCGHAGFAEDALSLLLLASDTISMRAGLGRSCSRDMQAAARQALTSARPGLDGPPRLCIALPEVVNSDANQVVAALQAALDPGCALIGGAAGATSTSAEPTVAAVQFFGAEVVEDALPVLLLAGPIECAVTIENSWNPVGERQRVTSVSGRDLARIGDRTALDFYHHYLGSHTEPVFEFPLAVFDDDSEHYYLRVPSAYDPETGVVRVSGPIPEGAMVQLTEAVRPHMLEQTRQSIRRAAESLQGARPVMAWVASCGVRRLVLGTQAPRELEIAREVLPTIPIFGMYASGEIAPLAPDRPSMLHQATLVTVILGVRDQAPAWTPPPASAPPDSLEFLERRLSRSERYRARLESTHERDHAMLRTIGDEIAASRELIRRKNQELERLYAELAREKQKSEELLLNILPGDVADELKRTGQVEPVYYDSVTVLFTDFKDFTRIAAGLSPQQLIRELDYFFSAFDGIIERHGLEKLKTIGDAYMCAGGIPAANSTHPIDAVRAAWQIQELMSRELVARRRRGQPPWELRIGVHTGPLMAGVIGNKKFAYDIWGDTVNIAARMESSGAPGRINLSRATYERVRDHFACEPRGRIAVKNAGEVDMYFVLAPV